MRKVAKVNAAGYVCNINNAQNVNEMEKQINIDVQNEKVTTIISSTGSHETCNFQEAGLYDNGWPLQDKEEIREIIIERETTWNPSQLDTWKVNVHFV